MKDYTGLKFGELTILEEAEPTIGGSGFKYRRMICKCSCGAIRNVFLNSLRAGHTQSCPKCGHKRRGKERRTHGLSNSRIYKLYYGMMVRCYCKTADGYKKYGGSGITVCDEWRGENGFLAFYQWAMENGYRDGNAKYEYTIDRIDNSKGYSPDNCRFVNAYVQANNRAYAIMVEDTDGERLTLKQLARKYDLSYGTVHSRWMRGKRTVEELKCKVRNNCKVKDRVAHFTEYGGELKTHPQNAYY